MGGIPVCTYNHEYFDHAEDSFRHHSCGKACVSNSKFCEYHDEKYFLENQLELKEKFKDEIQAQIKKYSKIMCVGWNIPQFELHWLEDKISVYFIDAKIHGNLDFSHCNFMMMDFTESTLYRNLEMRWVNVENMFSMVNFKSANPVISSLKFHNCIFNIMKFSNGVFGELTFQNCKFGYSEFGSSKFDMVLAINSCEFTDNVDFSKSQYAKGARFVRSLFRNRVIFQNPKFEMPTKFNHVIFKEPRQVIFDADLSNASFAYTDITRIEFIGRTRWDKDGKFRILDERNLAGNPGSADLSAVLATYRDLRENYEFRLMYEEAGRFFVREMEIRRNYLQSREGHGATRKRWMRRCLSLTNCYNVLSEYGQHFGRILSWCSAAFAVSMAVFYFSPDVATLDKINSLTNADHTSHASDFPHLFISALERTVSGFFQVEQKGLPEYAVRIASIPLLGVMFIVLKRRLERRFRH